MANEHKDCVMGAIWIKKNKAKLQVFFTRKIIRMKREHNYHIDLLKKKNKNK